MEKIVKRNGVAPIQKTNRCRFWSECERLSSGDHFESAILSRGALSVFWGLRFFLFHRLGGLGEVADGAALPERLLLARMKASKAETGTRQLRRSTRAPGSFCWRPLPSLMSIPRSFPSSIRSMT